MFWAYTAPRAGNKWTRVKYVVAASVPRTIAANRQYRSTAQLPYHPADCGAYVEVSLDMKLSNLYPLIPVPQNIRQSAALATCTRKFCKQTYFLI